MNRGISRRTVVAGMTGSAAFMAMDGSAGAAARKLAPPRSPLEPMLADFADQLLELEPTTATSLGVDVGKRAGLRARMADGGAAGRETMSAQMNAMRARLKRLDVSALTPAQHLQYKVADYASARGQDGAAFRYGGGAGDGFSGRAVPYVLSQLNGALTSIPAFLDTDHPVKSRSDAEAYLSRMAILGKVLDNESVRLADDAAFGVAPPAFIASTTMSQLKAFRAVAAGEQPMVASLTSRAREAGLSGVWGDQATRLIERAIYPALDRQIAAFETSTKDSRPGAGVDRLPDGDAYYAYALQLGTTTTISAQEVHRIGLEQNAEIKARIDTLLRSQGLSQGTVGERVSALTHDPAQLFPNTDQGRADFIAFINGRIAAIRGFQSQFSHMPLKAPVDVRRVPPDIQDGQPLGYMYFASLDGTRSAIYYVNLKATSLWSKYQLTSLSAHEAIPGHAWQGAYLAEQGGHLPLISSMVTFGAFNEGWALYAEQMMDELGLYKGDPYGRIGYLQALQMRAVRLVVDTGLHALRWDRARAIDFLVDETGKSHDSMTNEIDRYCVWPGQACGYKVGHNLIVKERDRARAALGARFDLAAFNDALIQTGGAPLALLPGVVDALIAKAGRT